MGPTGFGEWLFPNQTIITRNRVTGDEFYSVRNFQIVRLYRQGDIQSPLGRYCCRIPDSASGVLRIFCANLVGEFIVNNVNYMSCFFVTENNIRCPSDSVMVPINGIVSYSSPVEGGSYVYGTVATFSCSPGFSLDGTSTRTCETEQGTFSGTTPSCIGNYRIPSCTYYIVV